MQIHQIKKNKNNKTSIKVGRGGKRGKTSGKGHKGQNARTGNSGRPEIRDTIKRLPKLRGYRFKSFKTNPTPVNLGILNEVFENGESVNPKTLISKKVVARKDGKVPAMKILGTGEITKKLNFKGFAFSVTAKEKIEKAGGTIK
ncbi:50S ribosomal protein L15 [Patescibacteria group bacterium]|nr:50S ribosomal protein L15 [Patescibacteria group bacterium]MCG2694989.1 50S ribosomal protein L15 [Candidatus Parcubacteria bacterium]